MVDPGCVGRRRNVKPCGGSSSSCSWWSCRLGLSSSPSTSWATGRGTMPTQDTGPGLLGRTQWPTRGSCWQGSGDPSRRKRRRRTASTTPGGHSRPEGKYWWALAHTALICCCNCFYSVVFVLLCWSFYSVSLHICILAGCDKLWLWYWWCCYIFLSLLFLVLLFSCCCRPVFLI